MEKNYLLLCGKLFDGIHDVLQENMQVWVQGNRIRKVGGNLTVKGDYQVIDLRKCTVTPGMIDAHVHLSYFNWKEKRRENIFNSPAYKTLAVLFSAQKALERGFTTIRHVGCSSFDGYGSIDVKRVIEAGYFPGPRLLVAPMYLGVNGGPADHSQALKTNYQMAAAMRECYPSIGTGPDFFCNAVREQQKLGADFIKIMVSGSFYSKDSSPDLIYFRDDELRAIIETAHGLNMKVTAHTYGPAAMQKLARMGIDGIEHGALMDAETVKVMEECGTWLVPTFYPYDAVVNPDDDNPNNSDMAVKLERYATRLREGRKQILGSRLLLGYGTDIVFNHHNYECGYEYCCWLSSGADPFRVLHAATSNNARILGMDKEIGTLEEGKLADIAAWNRDLLRDKKALLDCAFVMKNGIVYPAERVE